MRICTESQVLPTTAAIRETDLLQTDVQANRRLVYVRTLTPSKSQTSPSHLEVAVHAHRRTSEASVRPPADRR